MEISVMQAVNGCIDSQYEVLDEPERRCWPGAAPDQHVGREFLLATIYQRWLQVFMNLFKDQDFASNGIEVWMLVPINKTFLNVWSVLGSKKRCVPSIMVMNIRDKGEIVHCDRHPGNYQFCTCCFRFHKRTRHLS